MLVILTLFIPKILTDDQCCPSGVYLGKGACSDGTNISIGCGRDSYLVTSADGELEVEEGILHILGEEDNFTIAKNR